MAPIAEDIKMILPISKKNGAESNEKHANGVSADHHAFKAIVNQRPNWHFDTIQTHAGLEDETAHGQCSLPIYTSASFKFKSSKKIASAFSVADGPTVQTHLYSRFSNVSSNIQSHPLM